MKLLTNSTYGKSTTMSILVHSAILVAFILMPPSAPVNSAKNEMTVNIIPVPEPIKQDELKQDLVSPKEEMSLTPEMAQSPLSQAEAAPQRAALPGETGANSVALQSGTGTAVPTVTGIPTGKMDGGGVGPVSPGREGKRSRPVSASRTYSPKPSYPREARTAGWEGSVVLRIQINEDGSVTVLSVGEAERSDVSAAAAQVVSTWRYSPRRDENGVAVASVRDVKVNFDLSETN